MIQFSASAVTWSAGSGGSAMKPSAWTASKRMRAFSSRMAAIRRSTMKRAQGAARRSGPARRPAGRRFSIRRTRGSASGRRDRKGRIELRVDRGGLHAVVGIQDQRRDRIGGGDVPGRAKLLGRVKGRPGSDAEDCGSTSCQCDWPDGARSRSTIPGEQEERSSHSARSCQRTRRRVQAAHARHRRTHASRPAASTRRRC